MNLQNDVQKIFEPFENKKSTPKIRKVLEYRLQYYFDSLDAREISRPVDFNVNVDENGYTVVYFSKDFT